MNAQEINSKLTSVFRDIFSDPTLEIRPEMTADDVADWDSLSHINLILSVEKAFNIKLTTREVRSMKNVGDFTDIIKQKVA
jgi:acyl carrier protein